MQLMIDDLKEKFKSFPLMLQDGKDCGTSHGCN